jgi:DNA-binding NtrC family response regulator
MALLSTSEWHAAKALAAIPFTNPFLRERIELEKKALGTNYEWANPFLVLRTVKRGEDMFPALPLLRKRSAELVEKIRGKLESGCDANSAELEVYEGVALFWLYLRSSESFSPLLPGPMARNLQRTEAAFWDDYALEFKRLFQLNSHRLPSDYSAEALFAACFQVERAFTYIFEAIVGGSSAAAELRATVWESIFSHDMQRYLRFLHRRMLDISTLIVGPSGSGKELVARAIAMSGFIRFNPDTRHFEANKSPLFVPLNLAALSPTLVESELFGSIKGAFTGAVDRVGWLKKCNKFGAVFLDEIGELDGSIQVKLLRVLQTRRFERVGSTKTLKFEGKIIAATNRDLAAAMHAGQFREDLYFRLCADQVTTPALAEQLSEQPDDLVNLVRFAARRILAPVSGEAADTDEEAGKLADEAVKWIRKHLGDSYPWPGNFRELEQCVRNLMIRGSYLPPSRRADRIGPVEELLHHVRGVEVTADELLARYYAMALHQSDGNYRAAGRRVGVDWRVVRDRHDGILFERLRNQGNAGRV